MVPPTLVETVITGTVLYDILDDAELSDEIVELFHEWLHEKEGYMGDEDENL